MGELVSVFGLAASAALFTYSVYLLFTKDDVNLEKIGKMSLVPVFKGAAENKDLCMVDAADLKSGICYNFNREGMVVVEGDLPENVEINVSKGKLAIRGNVAKKCTLNASVPCGGNSSSGLLSFFGGSKTIEPTGAAQSGPHDLTYARDPDPAVMITGDVAAQVKINSNHGIHIAGTFDTSASLNSTDGSGCGTVTTGYPDKLFVQNIVAPLTV